MNVLQDPLVIYLDQNILSHLREGRQASEALTKIFQDAKGKNVVFAYSMAHVDECRASGQPEAFVRVIDDLPVHLMTFKSASAPQTEFSLGKAQGLLMEAPDMTHEASRIMEKLLTVWHFASGWLGTTEAHELKSSMAAEMAAFWDSVIREVDWSLFEPHIGVQGKHAVKVAKAELTALIMDLPFDQTRDEWMKTWPALEARLPKNYAQLDAVPDHDAVSFILSCLDDRERDAVQSQFPHGGWANLDGRKDGALVGLAFLMFMCGLVRDRRVHKGTMERRTQHFLGQFRDGIHIENAARCYAFITCDEDAARLARCIYAYMGVKTQVIQMRIGGSAAP